MFFIEEGGRKNTFNNVVVWGLESTCESLLDQLGFFENAIPWVQHPRKQGAFLPIISCFCASLAEERKKEVDSWPV